MAVMNKNTNGGTKAKKDVEAMKKASEELLGMSKGKKYGAEAMPDSTPKKKKKTNGY